MPEAFTEYEFPVLAILVPVEVVCQYQLTPAGGAAAFIVTFPQNGELLVGAGGVFGIEETVTVVEAHVALHIPLE